MRKIYIFYNKHWNRPDDAVTWSEKPEHRSNKNHISIFWTFFFWNDLFHRHHQILHDQNYYADFFSYKVSFASQARPCVSFVVGFTKLFFLATIIASTIVVVHEYEGGKKLLTKQMTLVSKLKKNKANVVISLLLFGVTFELFFNWNKSECRVF